MNRRQTKRRVGRAQTEKQENGIFGSRGMEPKVAKVKAARTHSKTEREVRDESIFVGTERGIQAELRKRARAAAGGRTGAERKENKAWRTRREDKQKAAKQTKTGELRPEEAGRKKTQRTATTKLPTNKQLRAHSQTSSNVRVVLCPTVCALKEDPGPSAL